FEEYLHVIPRHVLYWEELQFLLRNARDTSLHCSLTRERAGIVAHDHLPLALCHVMHGDLEILFDFCLLRRPRYANPVYYIEGPLRQTPDRHHDVIGAPAPGLVWPAPLATDRRLAFRGEPFLVEVRQDDEPDMAIGCQA